MKNLRNLLMEWRKEDEEKKKLRRFDTKTRDEQKPLVINYEIVEKTGQEEGFCKFESKRNIKITVNEEMGFDKSNHQSTSSRVSVSSLNARFDMRNDEMRELEFGYEKDDTESELSGYKE